MWELVGIVRSDKRLEDAAARLSILKGRIDTLIRETRLTPDLLELRNLAICGSLIVASARSRTESRGLNFNIDHPYRDNERFLRDTVIGL